MFRFLKRAGLALLRPFQKLRARIRRNAIIIANASPEELRHYKALLDDNRRIQQANHDLLIRSRLPGSHF
jgi:hypothetical protein